MAAAAPLIDNRSLPNPVRMKYGEPATINVTVTGTPKPIVRWQIGRRRVKDSPKYQIKTNPGGKYSLVIARVSEELEQGVWILASNDVGEDCYLVEVQILQSSTGVSNGNAVNQRSVSQSQEEDSSSSDVPKLRTGVKKKKPRKLGDTQSVTSLDAWENNAAGSSGVTSMDDVTNDSTAAGWDPGQDLNQSYDPDVASRHTSRRINTKSNRQRFNSTDAIFAAGDSNASSGTPAQADVIKPVPRKKKKVPTATLR